MQLHPTAASVQRQACAALCNLTTEADGAVLVTSLGGVQLVLTAMKLHPASAKVQEAACAALCNLAAAEGG